MNTGAEEAVPRIKLPTNDVILAVAVDLFSSNGYDGTSMRDIAGKVGVRPASIYNHFSSKGDLLWAIILSTMTDLLEQQKVVLSRPGTPREQLTRFVITHVKFHTIDRKRALVRIERIGSLDPANHDRIHQMRHEYEQLLAGIMQSGVNDSSFNPHNSRLATYAILQMGVSVSEWYREDGVFSVEEICAAYVVMALQCAGARL